MMLRTLPVAMAILLAGCVANHEDAVRVAGTNYSRDELRFAHFVDVHRFGRFVYSKSVSIFYKDKSIQAVDESLRDAFVYERDGVMFEIKGPAACFPSATSKQYLTKAFDSLLSSINGWPVHGAASMSLATSHMENDVTRVLRSDGNYDLRFKSYCNSQAGDIEMWKRAMILLHESTHAVLRLAKATPRDQKQSERIAMGGEACLAFALAQQVQPNDPVAFLVNHEALENQITYYYSRLFPEQTEVNLSELCQAWRKKLRSTPKVLSKR